MKRQKQEVQEGSDGGRFQGSVTRKKAKTPRSVRDKKHP